MTLKLGIFLNQQMFAIVRLQYPIYHKFKIKFHISIPDINLNPYIYYTYISEVYKDLKNAAK